MKIAYNLGCGSNVKKSTNNIKWTNVDKRESENKLDVICDLTKCFPLEKESADYIYAEHLIEHFNWREGQKFLFNCYKTLKKGGILRLVFPDYEKIFRKYLSGDNDFFNIFYEELNNLDYPYYSEVYNSPEVVRRKRKDNPPPNWHLSSRHKDRTKLELRVKHFSHNIQIINWFTHQYGEHKTLYDYELLSTIFLQLGYSKVYETERKPIDSGAPSRITSSTYMEAKK